MAIDGNRLELRHGRTRLVLDPKTGSILRLEDAVSGLAHIDAGREGRRDGRLFRVLTPNDSWWSCYADSHEQPQVRCERVGDGLRLEYPDLRAADGALTGVTARVEIRPSPRADEFLLTLRLENRGRRTLLDAVFPLLGGWHGSRDRNLDRIATPGGRAYRSAEVVHLPEAEDGWGAGWDDGSWGRSAQRRVWAHPYGGMIAPWVDLSGPGGGLSCINYMAECRNTRFFVENLAGYGVDFRLLLGWQHYVALRPGETWTSPDMALAAHDGDWRRTADRYTAWFDQRQPPDYSRPAIRSRIGFQNVFFRGFDGTPIRPIESIPQVAASGRRYGVDLLCVWDTLPLGNYARHDPRDLFDYPPEERELIRRGLRQAEADGTRTCALVNFRHLNTALHFKDPAVADRVIRNYDGTFHTECAAVTHAIGSIWANHIGPNSYIFSPFSAAHRARVLRLTREYLDLGFSSMFWDQPINDPADYGFLDQGFTPDAVTGEAARLIAEARCLLLARDPQAVIIGENCGIHFTSCVDQWMTWNIARPSPALIEYVERYRYSAPHTILSWVMDREPDRASIAFAMGMQFCLMVHGAEGTLEDEPRFAEHVAALAALRKRTAARTVMARFRARDGLRIDGDESFMAWAYESERGPAVIVAAPGQAAKGRVRVERETFRATGAAGAGAISRLDGSRAAAATDTQEFALGANEVAVWEL